MPNNPAVMVVPNTKVGLDTIKYLCQQLADNDILIKLVSKLEFDKLIKKEK